MEPLWIARGEIAHRNQTSRRWLGSRLQAGGDRAVGRASRGKGRTAQSSAVRPTASRMQKYRTRCTAGTHCDWQHLPSAKEDSLAVVAMSLARASQTHSNRFSIPRPATSQRFRATSPLRRGQRRESVTWSLALSVLPSSRPCEVVAACVECVSFDRWTSQHARPTANQRGSSWSLRKNSSKTPRIAAKLPRASSAGSSVRRKRRTVVRLLPRKRATRIAVECSATYKILLNMLSRSNKVAFRTYEQPCCDQQ